jgi:hypothetical protein
MNIQETIDKVIAFRRKNCFQEALKLMNLVINDYADYPQVIAEALKLVVLLNNREQSALLYKSLLELPNSVFVLDRELYFHLETFLGLNRDPILFGKLKARTRWGEEKTENNDLPPRIITLEKLDITVDNGVSFFQCHFLCPECSLKGNLSLRSTFFQQNCFLCPDCFVPLLLKGRSILDFARKHCPELMDRNLIRYDAFLTDLQNRLGRYRDEEIPYLCRALNQGLVGLAGEIISDRVRGSL